MDESTSHLPTISPEISEIQEVSQATEQQPQAPTFREEFLKKLAKAESQEEKEALIKELQAEIKQKAEAFHKDCKAFRGKIYRTKYALLEENFDIDDKRDLKTLECQFLLMTT